MIDIRATFRNALLVTVAVAVSGVVLRPQIASALVTRGDELAYRGATVRARAMYLRAWYLDPRNAVALDRYAFSAMTSHDGRLVRSAIAMLDPALKSQPANVDLRFDRALCEQSAHRIADAARDFEDVGLRTRDARALTFAALDTSDKAQARALLRKAIAYAPAFIPARRDLERLQ